VNTRVSIGTDGYLGGTFIHGRCCTTSRSRQPTQKMCLYSYQNPDNQNRSLLHRLPVVKIVYKAPPSPRKRPSDLSIPSTAHTGPLTLYTSLRNFRIVYWHPPPSVISTLGYSCASGRLSLSSSLRGRVAVEGTFTYVETHLLYRILTSPLHMLDSMYGILYKLEAAVESVSSRSCPLDSDGQFDLHRPWMISIADILEGQIVDGGLTFWLSFSGLADETHDLRWLS
jgi:hypothetical protein